MEEHGKTQLIQALEGQGVRVVEKTFYRPMEADACLLIGRQDDPLMRRALQIANLDVQSRPEGVFFGTFASGTHQQASFAGGTDSRGLMYALLELADRVRADESLLALSASVEYPYNAVRGVTRFIVNHHDEAWMFDEVFLHWWYSRLARYRFNRVEYVMGFDTAYLSPPYPWFIAVDGFEHLRVSRLSDERRDANLRGLRRMGQLAHDYGLEFCLAPWQQKAWTRGQAHLVEGLPQDDDALIAYTERAVKGLLEACAEIDVFQLRVNHEAGVSQADGNTTNERYWQRIIDTVTASDHVVELELRAKGLTDGMIQYAQDKGLATTVPTKYWCEHFPVPYHISRMRDEELDRIDNLNHSRRYSYADMLRKPRSFEMIYRLWNYGTSTVFEWGDLETARRFSRTCSFGGAKGFVITAPLSLKGGMEILDNGSRPFVADPDYRSGAYEDERYFMWYLCFGRLGYNPDCDAEVWRRDIRAAYGTQDAHNLERALSAAGKILPLITTFHMPVHPSLIYWVEISTGGALFPEHNFNDGYHGKGYVNAKASDEGLFYAIDEYVDDYLARNVHGRYTPLQASAWLEDLAGQIDRELSAIEARGIVPGSPQARMTLVDLRMLATLARYHRQKTLAAIRLTLWQRTGNAAELPVCRAAMQATRDLWQALADLGRVYDDDLCGQMGNPMMNARRYHWRDRLVEMDKDLDRLDTLIREAGIVQASSPTPIPPEQSQHTMVLETPERWPAEKDMPVRLRVADNFGGDVWLHYRHTNLLEGDFIQAAMQRDGSTYTAIVPGDYLTPEWDLLLYTSARLSDDAVQIVPGLWHPDDVMPYRVIEIVRESEEGA